MQRQPGENLKLIKVTFLSQDLNLCIFEPPFPTQPPYLTQSHTELEGGRIKYVSYNMITNPKPKTTRLSERSREKPRVCEILVKKVERKDIGKWKYHLTFLSFPVLQYDKSMHIAVTHNDTETQNNIIIQFHQGEQHHTS